MKNIILTSVWLIELFRGISSLMHHQVFLTSLVLVTSALTGGYGLSAGRGAGQPVQGTGGNLKTVDQK